MNRRSWLFGALAGLVGVGAIAGATTTEQTLVVTDTTGTDLLTVPVSTGTELVVAYTHSVERTLVRDIYIVENGGFIMTRMEFSSFGAGLPAQADVTVEDGRYVYEPPEQQHAYLRVGTGFVADHDLIVDGDRYDLTEMADGNTVELRIAQRRSLL